MDLETVGKITLDVKSYQTMPPAERDEYYNYLLEHLREAGSIVDENGVPHDKRKLATFGGVARILRFTKTNLKSLEVRNFIINRLVTAIRRGQLARVTFTRHGVLKQGQQRTTIGYAVIDKPAKKRRSKMTAVSTTPKELKTDVIYRTLKRRIGVNYTSVLPSIHQLSKEFKVSPRTAHVAIRKLSAEGLIKLKSPRSPYVVAGIVTPTSTGAATLPQFDAAWSDNVKTAWFSAYAAAAQK